MNKAVAVILVLSGLIIGHVIGDIQYDRRVRQILASREAVSDAVKELREQEKDLKHEQYKRWRAQEFNMDYLGGGRYRMNGQ